MTKTPAHMTCASSWRGNGNAQTAECLLVMLAAHVWPSMK